jgi:ribosomal protein L40E
LGAFSSSKTIPVTVADLGPVANDLVLHFRQKGYETSVQPTLTGGWDVSITKGGVFKSVIGTKTALKIAITTGRSQTDVRASVGIFGLQAVPSAISLLLFWPLLVTQILGLVRQSHLDEEAMSCVEDSLKARAAKGAVASARVSSQQRFCVECGAENVPGAVFCVKCGNKLPVPGEMVKGAS